MSICKSIGNGIGGALGKFGTALGGALGLGAVVDLGTRAATGYGLLETLNVPYIECPDGSFATAIEWYGSGLKCPKKPESVKPQMSPQQKDQNQVAEEYEGEIEKLGGSIGLLYGNHGFGPVTDYYTKGLEVKKGHFYAEGRYSAATTTDEFGNTTTQGFTDSSSGMPDTFMFHHRLVFLDGRPESENFLFKNATIGRLRLSFKSFKNGHWWGTSSGEIFVTHDFAAIKRTTALLGIKVTLPPLPFAPAAASIPPPPFHRLNPPSPPEECTMNCPCLSPQEIEKIIKKALGIAPFSPEKLVREMVDKMFVAPGPSVIPIVPTSLTDVIASLVATVYGRAGYGRYPVIMPSSLINDDGLGNVIPTEPLENYAEWFEWFIKQQDAIQGEWPIDIAIVDGAKRQPLKFENISEALSEMTGLLIQTATDADAGVNAACTAAVAATKATNAAVVAQKNIECLIRFFGVRTGFKSIFVQSPITPADPDDRNFNIRKFLTPSGQNLAHLTDEDPFDFQAVLDRILRNTEISRASVARSIDKDGLPGDFARNQRKYDASESRREAEKDLAKLESSIQAKNPEFKVKIKLDTPVGADIPGNNFVIRRPPKKDE